VLEELLEESVGGVVPVVADEREVAGVVGPTESLRQDVVDDDAQRGRVVVAVQPAPSCGAGTEGA
jgi:tartrate dehydratase beta subunit/fumarate hydratase class I family protein